VKRVLVGERDSASLAVGEATQPRDNRPVILEMGMEAPAAGMNYLWSISKDPRASENAGPKASSLQSFDPL